MKTKSLVLVPTEFELNVLRTTVEFDGLRDLPVELCGFGAIVSAARTSQLLARYQPQRVCLVGIAGCYSRLLEVESAYRFSEVVCYGIGVGAGVEFQTSDQMGWKQWGDNDSGIGDLLDLTSDDCAAHVGQLLSCTSAAQGSEDVAARLSRFPHAVAEDMEGFSVAAACHLFGVECTIIRGISNCAGDRDKANWRVRASLQNAMTMVSQWIESE